MANSYEHLKIWQEGIILSSDIYLITKNFPKEEVYGLISQLRRAVISIPTNIAEGSGRSSSKDFSKFVEIAIGSLNEVESLLIISNKLGYVKNSELESYIEKIKNLGNSLGSFRRYLNKK